MLLLSDSTKEALKSGLSDMDYLRSKMAKTEDILEDSDEKNDGDDEEQDDSPVQPTDSAYESGDREKTVTSVSSEEDKKQSKGKKSGKQEVIVDTLLFSVPHNLFIISSGLNHICLLQMEPTTEFTVKLRGAPFNVKEVSEPPDFRDLV